MIMDAESRIGPNFGNLDIMTYMNGDLYERTANYLILKGMVCQWEKKVKDAEIVEKNPMNRDNYATVINIGDPKRYLPDPPILYTLRECLQVCLMSQQMTKAFVDTPELFDDLPVEVRFFEAAMSNKGGVALRRFMNEEFCPKEGITPAGLVEGMRRLLVQCENLQMDPYGDLTNLMDKLILAMAQGTDAAVDPYLEYLANMDPKGPGYFQTYTFNHDKRSRVRFFDTKYEEGGFDDSSSGSPTSAGDNPLDSLGEMFNSFGNMMPSTTSSAGGKFDFGDLSDVSEDDDEGELSEAAKKKLEEEEKSRFYKIPELRAAGRPHELGWIDMFDEEEAQLKGMEKIQPGRIITE